jgi:hypothetical protein
MKMAVVVQKALPTKSNKTTQKKYQIISRAAEKTVEIRNMIESPRMIVLKQSAL